MVKLFHIKIRKISFCHNSSIRFNNPLPLKWLLSMTTWVWMSSHGLLQNAPNLFFCQTARSLIGETALLKVQKLLSSIAENKVWERPYVNFGGLFSNFREFFFSEITYFRFSLTVSCSLFTKYSVFFFIDMSQQKCKKRKKIVNRNLAKKIWYSQVFKMF